MIKTETNEGFIRHYSDIGMKIRQVETGIVYDDAVDAMPCRYTYEETDIPIDLGAPPDNLEESAAYLFKGGMVEIPGTDTESDYFNEHEQEPDYFGG